MNFIVTSDIHLAVKPSLPREWQLNRYRMFFGKLFELIREYQAQLIVAGDLVDQVTSPSKRANTEYEAVRPNLDELNLLLGFFAEIKRRKIPTILISGNHCEVSSTRSIYDDLRVDEITDGWVEYGDGVFTVKNLGDIGYSILALNHNTIREYAFEDDYRSPDYHSILVSHFRSDYGPYVKEEVPVKDIIRRFDVVIAGDIHAAYQVDNLWYTNSPLNCTFESNPECGLILLSVTDKINIERIPLHLPNLIKHDCEAKDFETLVQSLDPYHYHKVAVRGTPAELRAIPNTFPQGITEKTVIMDEVTFELDSGATEEKEEKSEGATDDLVKYARRLGWGEEQVKRMVEIMEEQI